jgi:hypothetical protein
VGDGCAAEERAHRHAVGVLAARVILERSESVMRRYLQDKAAQGAVPLNRCVVHTTDREPGAAPPCLYARASMLMPL